MLATLLLPFVLSAIAVSAAPAPAGPTFIPDSPYIPPSPKPRVGSSVNNMAVSPMATLAPDAPLAGGFKATVAYNAPDAPLTEPFKATVNAPQGAPVPDVPLTKPFQATVSYVAPGGLPTPGSSSASTSSSSSPHAVTPAVPTGLPAGIPAPIAKPNPHANDKAFIQNILGSPNTRSRLGLLEPADRVFDFSSAVITSSHSSLSTNTTNSTTTSAPPPPKDAASQLTAESSTFPYLLAVSARGALSVTTLAPCAAQPAHSHPRAAELVLLTSADPAVALATWYVIEGASTAKEAISQSTLAPWQMTAFPQGAAHGFWNPSCASGGAVVVSAYVGAESADPGEFVGGEAVGGASLPAEVVSGVEECKRRCGLA